MTPDWLNLLAADGVTVVGVLLLGMLGFIFEVVVPGKRYRKVLQERDEAQEGRLEDAKEYAVIARALIRAKEKETGG